MTNVRLAEKSHKGFRSRALTPLAVALACAFTTGALAQNANGFTFPDTLGYPANFALGVSADGTVVVGWSGTADQNIHAFRWTNNVTTDIGALGGTFSEAHGVSANGTVVVGVSNIAPQESHAFRWTNNVMTDLGTLDGAQSWAYGVSADGAVVVGSSTINNVNFIRHAFRWANNVMTDLGTLGGLNSVANGVSANGSVVVGESDTPIDNGHAFRWANNVMTDLGTFGGSYSSAKGVSADGAVVVGLAKAANDDSRAFRWANSVMTDLGTLGGSTSWAQGVSADGKVVVGGAATANNAAFRAFRWTSAGGMQSVENWLRAAGVTVANDITGIAYATNSDGSVVVGAIENFTAFIARVASTGSGLVTLADVQNSLAATAMGSSMALGSGNLLIHGAHSQPLSRRVADGQKAFWVAGDWGRDDHGERNGSLGLAELGLGYNFGLAQINVSLGQTWAKQNLALNGQAKTDGTYLLAEALIPVAGNLWAVLGGYGHWGDADLRRGYLNAGSPDASTGKPGVDTWGLRARLEWDRAFSLAAVGFSPYADLSYSEAKMAAYTETGGGFPARFDARTDRATELRLGTNAAVPLVNELRLISTLEAVHRFEKSGARTSGQMVGLFAFDLPGAANKQDWLRAGVGVEGKLAGGSASLMVNATTQGESSNVWLAASWQKAF